jgi:hypothetical protein
VLQWRSLLLQNDEGKPHRAWSAEDASVLRRKGHLKEQVMGDLRWCYCFALPSVLTSHSLRQDALIELIISLCRTHTPGEAFRKARSPPVAVF